MTASVERRTIEWLLGPDRDESEQAEMLLATMLGIKRHGRFMRHFPVPFWLRDFAACLRLLDDIPEWRARLDEMRSIHEDWGPLLDVWDRLTEVFNEELRAAVKTSETFPVNYGATQFPRAHAIMEGATSHLWYEVIPGARRRVSSIVRGV